jgi:hypothetical protein
LFLHKSHTRQLWDFVRAWRGTPEGFSPSPPFRTSHLAYTRPLSQPLFAALFFIPFNRIQISPTYSVTTVYGPGRHPSPFHSDCPAGISVYHSRRRSVLIQPHFQLWRSIFPSGTLTTVLKELVDPRDVWSHYSSSSKRSLIIGFLPRNQSPILSK